MRKDNFEKLNSSIQPLQNKHFEFEKLIELVNKSYFVIDSLKIEKLKKEKLKIKDMILEKEIDLKSLNKKSV